MGRRACRKAVTGWFRGGDAGFRARWVGILGALFGAGGHRSPRIRVEAWDERENRGRRQPKPVLSMVRQTLNSRSVVGCQPMILSVVRRARRMTCQGTRIISRTKRLNSMATYFRRSAFRCIIMAKKLFRFHASAAITM